MSDDRKSNLVEAQLHFLEENTHPEAWKLQHDIAMLCQDTQDLVPHALATFDSIKRRARSYADDLRALNHPASADEEAQLTGWYHRWHEIGEQLLATIKWLESQKHTVERSTELRFALNEVTIYLHADEVRASAMGLRNGEGRTLDEIVNALSAKAV